MADKNTKSFILRVDTDTMNAIEACPQNDERRLQIDKLVP